MLILKVKNSCNQDMSCEKKTYISAHGKIQNLKSNENKQPKVASIYHISTNMMWVIV